MPSVALVDEQDQLIGSMEKLRAHQDGHLHRAFSVLIWNERGDLLLQQRASTKYHCAGLWSNTCCSHPAPEAAPREEAERRLVEEMGISVPLSYVTKFTYHASLPNGLTEYECDYVFEGTSEATPNPNPHEVDDWTWKSLDSIKKDVRKRPNAYTPWFKIIINNLI